MIGSHCSQPTVRKIWAFIHHNQMRELIKYCETDLGMESCRKYVLLYAECSQHCQITQKNTFLWHTHTHTVLTPSPCPCPLCPPPPLNNLFSPFFTPSSRHVSVWGADILFQTECSSSRAALHCEPFDYQILFSSRTRAFRSFLQLISARCAHTDLFLKV